MAARKPSTSIRRAPTSPLTRMVALYDALDGISRLFGGSSVTFEDRKITLSVRGFSDRVYRLDRDGALGVTSNVGTQARPRFDTSRTIFEEPIAFLLEHTSPHDAFSDAHENVGDLVDEIVMTGRLV